MGKTIHMHLTIKGQALNAKIQAGDGNVPLEITRVVTASGRHDDPLNLDNVVDMRQTATITDRRTFGIRAAITIILTNQGNPATGEPPLLEGYSLTQFGMFALDPDEGEILYRISQFERPDFVPAATEMGWTINPTWNFVTENASEVIVKLDPAAVVTTETLQLHNQDPEAHSALISNLKRQIDEIPGIQENLTAHVQTSNAHNWRMNPDTGEPEWFNPVLGDWGFESLPKINLSNPNILHNWDFRNPVNQRGQTVYTSPNNTGIYSIDRWMTFGIGTSLAVLEDCIQITRGNVTGGILEPIEFPELYSGKVVTLSVITRGNATGSARILTNTLFQSFQISPSENWTLTSRTFTLPDNIPSCFIYIDIPGASAGNNLQVQAVKLEIGTISTLANDPPMDFGRELAICQRYQQVLNGFYPRVFSHINPNFSTVTCFVPLQVPMRISPVFVGAQPVMRHDGGVSNTVSDYTFDSMSQTSDGLGLYFTFRGPPTPPLREVVMGAVGILDANL